ncbi:MAG: hypothetical protein SGJ10_05105 [Bacteroidota bacterium]|nr:hypothetical protein [Bacteroidota bacterium]
MKPTQFFSLLLLSYAFVGCAPSTKISKKTISHNYYNIIFSPEQILKSSLGKVDVIITPIDAASINRETFEAASRDGNYEKELATAIEKEKSKLDGLSKSERAYVKGKINGIDAVSKLEKENLIPSYTAYLLMLRILYGKEYGNNGREVASLSDVELFADNYNPYKINQKYLSVFKVTFENKGNEIEKIRLKELQVVGGEELLYPLGIEYFENNLKDEPEKIKNAYRMNMPEELVLTPSQRITKFIAIPAINPKNENLQVQIIKGKEIINFDFKVKEKEASKNYLVESYEIFTTGLGDPLSQYFYCALNYEKGVSLALSDARIFVSEEKKTVPVSVYVVAIDMKTSKARTARKVKFRFGEQKKNKVIVPFESSNKE